MTQSTTPARNRRGEDRRKRQDLDYAGDERRLGDRRDGGGRPADDR